MTVVAVVPHGEILALGNLAHKAVRIKAAVFTAGELGHLRQVQGRSRLGTQYVILLAAVVFAVKVALEVADLVFDIVVSTGLLVLHRLAVDDQLLVAVLDRVARQAHDALDEVDLRIGREVEHHHIAPFHLAHRYQHVVHDRGADAVGKLVDEDEVAHHQSRPHRR